MGAACAPESREGSAGDGLMDVRRRCWEARDTCCNSRQPVCPAEPGGPCLWEASEPRLDPLGYSRILNPGTLVGHAGTEDPGARFPDSASGV